MSDDVYDTFRGRIMIPIRDKQRRIIAFTARILPDILANDTNAPKYINSSTSLIYDKSNSLFGIDVSMECRIKKWSYELGRRCAGCDAFAGYWYY